MLPGLNILVRRRGVYAAGSCTQEGQGRSLLTKAGSTTGRMSGINCCPRWLPLAVVALHFSFCRGASCPSGNLTFVRKPFFRLLLEDISWSDITIYEGPPDGCHRICSENVQCTSYFVNHVNNTCVMTTSKQDVIKEYLLEDSLWSYHRKICIKGSVCQHHWTFDSIPGFQLYDYNDKTIQEIDSEELCIEACVSEDTFICRSARYDSFKKVCVLSRHDRRTAAESFRRTQRTVEYLENQCIKEPPSCTFSELTGRTVVHQHLHVEKPATTQELCEMACLNHSDFTCRSFVFDMDSSLCILSPEDSFSIPEVSARQLGNHSLYEKESCIDVQVHCDPTAMTAVVRVRTPFRGRVYAVGHPYDCYAVSVSDRGEVALSLPLHGRTCGTKNLGNGTFTNSIVVQHHPFVLRNTDRRVDITCDFEEVKMKLRAGKTVAEGELQSLTHVVTAVAPTPPVVLKVVNSSNQEVKGVELGDPLFLQVQLLDESVFGIFGSDLVARSGQGSESVLLIDDRGCPVEPSVFPSLERQSGSKSLIAPFQAFKFASDATVKFQLTVSFCLDQCLPMECDAEATVTERSKSYGRRRRSAEGDSTSLELKTGDVVSDVTMESTLFVVNSLSSPREIEEKPLQFVDIEERPIQTSNRGLCLTLPALYTSVAIVGTVQVAIIGTCVFLMVASRKSKGCPGIPGHFSSRASISSKTGLCGRS